MNASPLDPHVAPPSESEPRPSLRTGKRKRPMVALLIHYVDRAPGGYEYSLRQAFVRACRDQNVDFLLVNGYPLDDPDPDGRAHNQLYDLLRPDDIDAVILIPAGVCAYTGIKAMLARLRRLSGLPRCSLGMTIPEIPSVVVDNRPGMAAAVDHLIRVHGRRKLAFLGASFDNVDCQVRTDVVLEIVRRHGFRIPAHRQLSCWLESRSAESATLSLLERDRDVDGIVAINDGAAAGAMQALRRMGLKVPDQVAVTGYDDLPVSKFLEPGLTTVSQSLEKMAEVAVRLIVDQLLGRSVAPVTQLPSKLVIRGSCGCRDTASSPNANEWIGIAREAYDERLQLEAMYGQIQELCRTIEAATTSRELDRAIAEQLSRIHPGATAVRWLADGQIPLRSIVPGRLDAIPTSPKVLPTDIGDPTHPRALLLHGVVLQERLRGLVAFELGERAYDYTAICYAIARAQELVSLREASQGQGSRA